VKESPRLYILFRTAIPGILPVIRLPFVGTIAVRLNVDYLDPLKWLKERFKGAFLSFSNSINTRAVCYSWPDNLYLYNIPYYSIN